MNNEIESTENGRIVIGKICEACNVSYSPDTIVCPKCGSSNLKELITTSMLQDIKEEKERKKKMWIMLFICFAIMIALIVYAIIRVYIENGHL